MQKDITITFHNKGLRSYIEVDLCSDCPRQDDKGCCGYYSPVFYPSDFAYLIRNKPELLDYILNLEDITILDASITVNNSIEGESYRCQFHRKDSGCILEQELRESICRHFVCPGINWESEESLQDWKDFFSRLSEYEISINNKIAQQLKNEGLTLRNAHMRDIFFERLLFLFEAEIANLPEFLHKRPDSQSVKLSRQIEYGTEWPL
jgi:hypothetical protein